MSTIKTKIPLNNINMLSKEDFDNVNFEEHPNELFYTLDETDVIYSDVDAQLSDISENPVQNKVITKALNDKVSNEDISLDANTFAESERQKSKNLCGLKNLSQTLEAGLTCVFNEQTQTITFNGSPTGAVDCMREIKNLFPLIKNMENKQVTISLIYVSGKWTSGNARYYLGSLDNGSAYNDRVGNALLNREADTIGLYTIPTNNTYDDLHFYMGAGCVFNNYILKVQIEEGTVATDYQPYNGAIIHEKQFTEAVEKRELLFNIEEAVNIESSELTTLKAYFDLFQVNQNVIYFCNIGKLINSNFKSIVGTPPGFANYVHCYIKKIVNGYTDNGRFYVYELIAFDDFNSKTAKGYIYLNGYDTVVFTGWTVIGG